MENFSSMQLPKVIAQSLEKLEFITPTPIQAKSIPIALEGKDVLGSAQTGTGKTAAFGIPLAVYLIDNPQNTALVVTPTRELAEQVIDMLTKILNRACRSVLLIGGTPIERQIKRLKDKPRLIVGTPGRINDHIKRGTLKLGQTGFLVLDETDRMLDMGFSIQIDDIVKHMPEKRQTMLFSATLPDNIMKIAKKYMTDPQRVAVGNSNAAAAKIKQEIRNVTSDEKYPMLLNELSSTNGLVLVFVKTKIGAKKLALKLVKDKISADAIHGDLHYQKRQKVMLRFKESKCQVLVATDVAARGLDIPNIEHVVNFDLPQCPEDYIHRIGRTGRAGSEGTSLCFVTSADKKQWAVIERLMNPDGKKVAFSGSNAKKERGFSANRRKQSSPQSKFRGKNTFKDRQKAKTEDKQRTKPEDRQRVRTEDNKKTPMRSKLKSKFASKSKKNTNFSFKKKTKAFAKIS